MSEFAYSDLLPTGPDTTEYRLITTEGVSTFEAEGQTFLKVEPEAIQALTKEAMYDIAHYLPPSTSSSWHRSSTIRKPRRTTRSWPRSFSATRTLPPPVCSRCVRTPARRS